MLSIVKAPNVVLSQQAKTIEKVDTQILTLIKEMKQTLANTHDPEGVGLAAPQVGKSLQLFIAKPTEKSPVSVFINPTIADETLNPIPSSKKPNEHKLEGCLSLPNIWGFVKRNPNLTISYLDEHRKHHTKKFTGFMATIIQHEMDHLQGTLFPKRVLEQNNKLYKSHKEKGKDVFEEITI